MPKKLFESLFAILFVSSSCTKVHFSNAEICADVGEHGAFCAHTLSDEERDLEKEDWDELRYGWLCMHPETWAEVKAALLKLCKETKNLCTYEEVKAIDKVGALAQDMIAYQEFMNAYEEGGVDNEEDSMDQ